MTGINISIAAGLLAAMFAGGFAIGMSYEQEYKRQQAIFLPPGMGMLTLNTDNTLTYVNADGKATRCTLHGNGMLFDCPIKAPPISTGSMTIYSPTGSVTTTIHGEAYCTIDHPQPGCIPP